MKKLFVILATLFTGIFYCQAAGNYNTEWQKANEWYSQKQYDSAAYYLEKIAVLRPRNAEVYYNLGNTYYRLNKIAPSVLNYERALRINPDYTAASDNLALAQSRISNHIHATHDIFFIAWWQSATRADKATAWSVTALILFVLFILSIGIRRFHKTLGRSIPSQLPGIFVFTCICFLILAFAASRNMEEHTSAVVMQNDAPLMNNEQKGKPLIQVPEGTTVKITSEKGAWAEVTLPDGRSGWLQVNLMEKI